MSSTVTQSKTSQAGLSPDQIITLLKEGNSRFVQQTPLDRNLKEQIDITSTGQYPYAAIVSCIDSRIPTEIVFDQGIGDIFNARVAGNIVNEDILGSLEFACKLAGSKVIVIMGHTSCGAVKGACDHAQMGNLTTLLSKIQPAVNGTNTADGEDRSSKNIEFVNKVSAKNIELTIQKLLSDSPVLRDMSERGEIKVVGAMYSVSDGSVTFS